MCVSLRQATDLQACSRLTDWRAVARINNTQKPDEHPASQAGQGDRNVGMGGQQDRSTVCLVLSGLCVCLTEERGRDRSEVARHFWHSPLSLLPFSCTPRIAGCMSAGLPAASLSRYGTTQHNTTQYTYTYTDLSHTPAFSHRESGTQKERIDEKPHGTHSQYS
mmetsp:Transcript_5450/g.12811  ORF Transcript_5450/g.12811 Transcript_5450/m.12811 type:complete len:164 (-) Transcript_5450:1586-2077(-)